MPWNRLRRATGVVPLQGEAASAARGVHLIGHITPVSARMASSGTSCGSACRSGT
jgi:hypothetical protein